jgi:glycosyltransferase involved in cell wall biosynthesis
LLAAYDFPPIASAGMYRVTSMARHLTRLGWNVTVLTVEKSYVFQSQTTERLIADGVRVERTKSLEYKRAKRWVGRKIFGREMPDDPEGTVADSPAAGAGRSEPSPAGRSLVRRIQRVERLLMFPDAKAGWFLPLLARAEWLISRNRYDVVLTSSPPHSTHLPFLLLRRFKRFKWVADFRDPWTVPKRGRRAGRSYEIEHRMERSVLARCDAIIANTPGNKRALVDAFPGIPEDKIEVITNGFDHWRAGGGGAQRGWLDGFDIAYFGAVYPGMLDSYAKAIQHLVQRGYPRIPRLAIFGKLPIRVRSAVIAANGLGQFIEFKGRVTDEESYELMKAAKSLLLLLPPGEGMETWVPSKLYTYLSTPTPIFAIVPKGDAWDIVESAGGGCVIDGRDPIEVGDRLVRFLRSIESGTYSSGRRGDAVEGYSWDTLSLRLDGLLRKVGERDG